MRTILLCLVLVATMTSCAVTRENVSIQYEPIQGTEKVANADRVPVQVQVSDNRPSKERVGRKMNGYGMQTASIMSENDVSLVVKDAISDELKNRGFVISDDKNSSSVSVDLRKFYNDFKPGMFIGKAISEMVLVVHVVNGDKKPSFSKTLMGTGFNRDVLFYSGSNAKVALEDALKNTVSELMNDPEFISALIEGRGEEGAITQLETPPDQ